MPSLPNVSIYGNTIGDGYYSTGSLTAIKYDALLMTDADCNIVNNIFGGQTSNASLNMIELDEGSCHITDNVFVRGGSTVRSYINDTNGSVTNFNSHFIVNNRFDSPTCNGTTDENLVKGIYTGSIYEKNVNQTGYATIHWSSHMLQSAGGAFGAGFVVITGLSMATSQQKFILFELTNTTQRSYIFSTSFREYLPKGVKLISAKTGIMFNGTVIDGGGINSMVFRMQSQTINISNYTAGLGSILDVQNQPNSNPFYPYTWTVSSTTSLASAPVNTLYNTLDLLGYPYGEEMIITAELEFNMKLSSGNVIGGISPGVVKYRW